MNDLEYYARNMHEWPGNDTNNVIKTLRRNPNSPGVTKDQWLAERARLQNKPSWEDAPDDAEWQAQDSDGVWAWYWKEPYVCNDQEQFCGNTDDGYICLSNDGEVLGDWRDTLEPRPEGQTMTKKEWRGPEDGLPPLGIGLDGVKRFSQNGVEEWQNEPYWRVVGHHIDGKTFFIEAVNVEKPFTQKFSIECNGEPQYRALRTEEEKAVDDMHRIVFDNADKISVDDVCRILYRHGYRKLDKPDASN